MKLKHVLTVCAATCLMNISVGIAGQFDVIGVRALGMAGSNVASVRDGNATYWNPAALGFFSDKEHSELDNAELSSKDWGLGVDAGFALSVHGALAQSVDTIGAIDFAALQAAAQGATQFTPLQIADSLRLVGELQAINYKSGLMFRPNAEVDVRWGHYAMGVHLLGGVSASPFVDTANLAMNAGAANGAIAVANAFAGNLPAANGPLTTQYFNPTQATSLLNSMTNAGIAAGVAQNAVQQADAALLASPAAAGQQAAISSAFGTLVSSQTGGSINQNTSKVLIRGVALLEIPLSYGYMINPNLSLGVSLKLMQGRVFATNLSLFNQQSGGLENKATNYYKTSNTVGIDLGALYRLPKLQFGLTVKNLNSPSFSGTIVDANGATTGATYTYKLKPQARAGVAYMPFKTLTLESDFDLTKNDTLLAGYSSQVASLGVEWDAFRVLALRGGAYKNIAENDIGVVYTAGIGINLWAARLDIAAAMGSKTVQYKGKSYPSEARLSAALNVDF